MTLRDILPQTIRASELYGDFWFNSEPVPVSALRGSVILIQFWDFACDACLRTLPYTKEWQKKYARYGLTVIGVHTPRFQFADDPEGVQRAIERYGITYPVVMDNSHQISTHYDSRAWPTMFVVDKNGFIRYESAGEGNYAGIERAIQALLYDAGVGEELPLLTEPMRDTDRTNVICYKATPELLAGYLRGSIGNVEGQSPESVMAYKDPEFYLDSRIYADGEWLNEKESLKLEGPEGEGGHLIVSYQALEANGVFDPHGVKDLRIVIEQDGHFLSANSKGDDVRIDARGRSTVLVKEARVYSLVKNREYGEHLLRLSIAKIGFRVFSFSFVTSAIPELVSNN